MYTRFWMCTFPVGQEVFLGKYLEAFLTHMAKLSMQYLWGILLHSVHQESTHLGFHLVECTTPPSSCYDEGSLGKFPLPFLKVLMCPSSSNFSADMRFRRRCSTCLTSWRTNLQLKLVSISISPIPTIFDVQTLPILTTPRLPDLYVEKSLRGVTWWNAPVSTM